MNSGNEPEKVWNFLTKENIAWDNFFFLKARQEQFCQKVLIVACFRPVFSFPNMKILGT